MRPVTVEHVVSQYFASMPTAGVVADSRPSSGAGYYVYLYGNYQPFGHAGMDFACPIGTKVYAMADGVVMYAGWGYNLPGTGPVRKWLLYANFPGIVTVIQHPGWIGVYAHLSDNDMAPAGTTVRMGQLIALSGNTGGVAAHLHVESLVDLTYRTGGGLIYGRTDPSKFFGSTGMAAMGSVTESTPEPEEPLVPNEADKVFWPIEGNEKVSLNELLNSIDRKSSAANAKVDLLLEAIGSAVTFTAIDGNTVTLAEQLRSLDNKAERERAENAALRAALDAVTTNSTVTPEQIQATIQDALTGFSITLTAGQ